MHLQSRIVVAQILCFVSFLLSLLVLTAGLKPGFIEGAAILFITSKDANSTYGSTYGSTWTLSPVDLFAGGNDWAAVYYLAICKGYFQDDGVSKTNTSCSTQTSLEAVFNLQRAFIPWTIGVGLTGLDVLLLAFLLGGRRHWNGWMMTLIILTFIFLSIGGAFGTVSSLLIYRSQSGGFVFVAMTWAAVGCVLAASFVHSFEYGLQRWTPVGEIIAAKYKPPEVPWISYG